MATYVPNARIAAEPLDTEKARTAAAEFREIKKYITKIPVVSVSADKTFALDDAGKTQLHPTADTTARLWTIPSNASVPYEVGTLLHFSVASGAGAITLGITADQLFLLPFGTTASVTMPANSRANAQKIAATVWQISGVGIS